MPTMIFDQATNSNLARDSDDASPLLAQAETSSGSLEWDILFEEAAKLWKQGDYRRGISVARKALEVAETSFGKNDINTGKSINLLGLLYEAQGDYAAAEPLYQRALAIREKILGTQHPDTADISQQFGIALRIARRLRRRRTSLINALWLSTKRHSERNTPTRLHLSTIWRCFTKRKAITPPPNLSINALWLSTKRHSERNTPARPYLSTIWRRFTEAQGDYAAAEPLHKRALAIREKTLGAQHPSTATSLNKKLFARRLLRRRTSL